MREDTVISALIGLAGACGSNEKTAGTDRLLLRALAFAQLCPKADADALQALVEAVHAEKFTIAPGCATCASPCGNTSDYDMRRLYEAAGPVREAKLRVMARLQELAAEVCRSAGDGPPPVDTDFFYKALSYLSYDLDPPALLGLLDEADGLEAALRQGGM